MNDDTEMSDDLLTQDDLLAISQMAAQLIGVDAVLELLEAHAGKGTLH